jgi:iron(III) transport system permease protein
MGIPRLFSLTIVSLFGIIVLLPIFYMMIAPFWVQTAGHSNSYGSLLFDERHVNLARNSLGVAVGTTFLSLIIAIPLAFLFYRTDLPAKELFRIIYIIPFLIPPYIHAIVWSHLNTFIERFFSLDIHSLWGVIFVLTLAYFPFVTLVTMSGLKSIDRNLEEASLLCHGAWKTLTRVTLPLVTPHIFSGGIFVFIFSLIDFGVPDILRVNVYPVEIFIQFSALYNEGAATLLSLPLIAITIFLMGLQKWHMKNRSYIHISGGVPNVIRYSLGRLNIVALGFCFAVLGLSIALPIVVMLKVAGPLSNYVRTLMTSKDQIVYSLFLALSGAMVTLFLAFPLSYLIERSKTGIRAVLLQFASFVPLAIPATTLGIGLIKVWNRPVADLVYGSTLIIVLGYIARFIPFLIITTTSGLKQVSPHLEEVAFLTTRQWTKVTRKIVLPLLRHSLMAGFYLVFILSFGELGTTLLVIPPGTETIPIKIFNLMHYGAEQMVAALCLILIAVIFFLSGLFLLLNKRLTKGI